MGQMIVTTHLLKAPLSHMAGRAFMTLERPTHTHSVTPRASCYPRTVELRSFLETLPHPYLSPSDFSSGLIPSESIRPACHQLCYLFLCSAVTAKCLSMKGHDPWPPTHMWGPSTISHSPPGTSPGKGNLR